MNVSFLQELLNTIAEQGRQLLPRSLGGGEPKDDITELADALVSVRGEASGVAIAREILNRYRALSDEERRSFLEFLAETLQPDPNGVTRAAKAYLANPSEANVAALQRAVESPRQEFFRRLNLAPGATAEIVAMRRDIMAGAAEDAALARVDADLMHLLSSWFNRGFLVLRRIDWQTPAAILEKIIAYEAVHEIRGWDDLRRRLDPADRRCFAFFHPSLIDEPLIFVEVALTNAIPDNINTVLEEAPKGDGLADKPTTAVFYSISNCQEGLRGISFGNFLIKQVVDDLVKERASLKTFVTLSPVPRFAKWLEQTIGEADADLVSPAERDRLRVLADPDWIDAPEAAEALKPVLLRLAAHYFLTAKAADGGPVDPVARFHLGNGARLERINWLGDTSPKGLREAHGLMVNYRYEIRDIEKNHEAYENEGVVAVSRQVSALLKAERSRGEGGKLLLLPSLLTSRAALDKEEGTP
ncbi:MAG: malonyl-CoA decarboxylase [Hyphomicrobiaceae bacterium]|nr:MAG: malonyl-CoA decarboxylase [Hyphomicrobiaceae bacterium]